MADETKDLAALVPKTQEELNVEMYGRVYETFLKKAEEMGKARGWSAENTLDSAEAMYSQYFYDQVQLTKDHKLHWVLRRIMENIPALQGLRF
jgi:hypothetical protein